jgi:hypothetical protein
MVFAVWGHGFASKKIAEVAQWQSTAFVKRGLWVQLPSSAYRRKAGKKKDLLAFLFFRPFGLQIGGIYLTLDNPR